jgi:hypothetical protein
MSASIKAKSMAAVSAASLTLGVLSLAHPASAATMSYTSSRAFFNALGAKSYIQKTETYEGSPANTLIASGSSFNGIVYNFPGNVQGRIDGNNFNRFDNFSLAAARTGDPESFFFQGESLSVTFPQAVHAIGAFFNAQPSPTGSLFINTPSGSASTGGVDNGGNGTYDTSTFYFAGLISDTPFTTATIGASANAGSGFNIDNLTYAAASQAIPTPAMLPGLVGLGLGLWRKRKHEVGQN